MSHSTHAPHEPDVPTSHSAAPADDGSWNFQRRLKWLVGYAVLALAPAALLYGTWPPEVSSQRNLSMLRLQFAPTTADAIEVLSQWSKLKLLPAARANLRADQRFIAIYSTLGILTTLVTTEYLFRRRGHDSKFVWTAIGLLSAIAAAAALDAAVENPRLGWLVDHAAAAPDALAVTPSIIQTVDQLRFAAQLKMLLLGAAAAANLALVMAALRQQFWPELGGRGESRCLIKSLSPDENQELALISQGRILRPVPIHAAPSAKPLAAKRQAAKRQAEPFAAAERLDELPANAAPGAADACPLVPLDDGRGERPDELSKDLIGLALSGGGIRSATFALGILSRLGIFGLLSHVDFLSTVSGGGYIGGWWTAWRKKSHGNNKDYVLPKMKKRDDGLSEAPEVRHLRVFSNFLVARRGLLSPELWWAITAILCSLVPALAISCAVLLLVQFGWLGLLYFTSGPELSPPLQALLAAGITTVLCLVGPRGWSWTGPEIGDAKSRQTASSAYLVAALAAIGLTTGAHFWLASRLAPAGTPFAPLEIWRDFLGMIGYRDASALEAPPWDVRPFALGLAWLAAAAGVGLLRLIPLSLHSAALFEPDGPAEQAALRSFDRVLSRLLLLAGAWLLSAGLWQVAAELGALGKGGAIYLPLVGSVSSAAAFAWFRNQLLDWLKIERSSSKWRFWQPYVPKLLAAAALGLFYVGTAGIWLRYLGAEPLPWIALANLALLVVAVALPLPPERFGLHEFYRSRISRTFLGATTPEHPPEARARSSQFNAQEQPWDDFPLGQIPAGRPYHLICCAANDVAGDPLKNLGRGARSATLSRLGLQLDDAVLSLPHLSFSSALTASAAAFNSQMGHNSIAFGPAVAFLMCALNLRLGLWLPRPQSDGRLPTADPVFPGWLRFREMFNLTHAGPDAKQVHLSDGGHFENLGLYELVRRRCRFIIVSDAGADPNVKFEDFGNAVRRIREDFGYDIEIDLEPLRPDTNGLSKQHVAVGTIRYNPNDSDCELGCLIYFKPTLTGDEPVDVLNYRTLNPLFPHQTTVDQFFDEAQWESYRMLGSHAAFEAFRFLDGNTIGPGNRHFAIESFLRAMDRWHPTPPDFNHTLQELNGRFLDLERRLDASGAAQLIADIYPELPSIEPPAPPPAALPASPTPAPTATPTAAPPAPPPVTPPAPPPVTPPTAATVTLPAAAPAPPPRMVHLVIEMMQLIEDVWLAAELDRNWNHPQMIGWMNAFRRWTSSPIVCQWWPFLAPLFTPGMREFAETHLKVPIFSASRQDRLETRIVLPTLLPTPLGRIKLDLRFQVRVPGMVGWSEVATAKVTRFRRRGNAGRSKLVWTAANFSVREGMAFPALASAFLRQVVEMFGPPPIRGANPAATTVPAAWRVDDLEVRFSNEGSEFAPIRGRNRRELRHRLLLFYKANRFVEDRSNKSSTYLVRRLRPLNPTP